MTICQILIQDLIASTSLTNNPFERIIVKTYSDSKWTALQDY
jgi:hypothetical protein